MTGPPFEGVGVALVTLFDNDGRLDAPSTADLASKLVAAGVAAIVVAGSTGEAASLDLEERTQLLTAVRAAVRSVPVIAGTGAPSARQAAIYTERAVDAGADAVLVLSPPGTSDPRDYYEVVAKRAGRLPVLAYHFPATSPPGIPVGALADLPVDGCKDSSGDAQRLLLTATSWDRPVYTGSSALLSFAGPLGCAGAILALANAEPELCIAAFGGDIAAQRRLVSAHFEAQASFPAGIKGLTARRFGTSATRRMGG
jgi:4-hydroxy-tetrahydrodipicolinate synthase